MIRFNNTYFSYDGKPLISGFSVNISRNEKVVLYGPSGSGKSTLVHAILGFVQPEQGEITVNNLPLSPNAFFIRTGCFKNSPPSSPIPLTGF